MIIFLDMDGVFADFNGGYENTFGVPPPPYVGRSKAEENAMWDNINSVPNFFATLPVIPGAFEFYEWLCENTPEHVSFMFLTACPRSDYHGVAKQKKEWIREALWPYSPVVLPTNGSEAKPVFLQDTGDILIDDWDKNCEAWLAAGGTAIQFTGDWEEVKEKVLAAIEHC